MQHWFALSSAAILIVSFLLSYHDLPWRAQKPEDLYSWLVVACAGIVVALSLAFEIGYDWLEESLKRRGKAQYEKVLVALRNEVTLLGFISLCIVLSVKSGLIHWAGGSVSDAFKSGHGHGDKGHGDKGHGHEHGHEHAAHELLELFEDVHVLIFLVMATFLLIGVWLLHASWTYENELFEFGELSSKKIAKEWHAAQQSGKPPPSKLQKLMGYRAMRREFIMPSHGQPERLIKACGASLGRFRFSLYLSFCMIETVLELLEPPPTTYLLFLFIVVLLRPFFILPPPGLLYTIAALPVILLAALWILDWNVSTIHHMLTPPPARVLYDHDNGTSSTTDGRRGSLFEQMSPSSKRPRHGAPYHDLPHQHSKSSLTTWLGGTATPTRHEQLFLFWKNGPEFLLHCLRLSMLCLTAYIALFVKLVFGPGWTLVCDYPLQGTLCAIAALLSCGAALKILPVLVQKFSVVTHIEQMKHRGTIKHTLHLMTEGRNANYFQMLVSLRHSSLLRRFVTPAGEVSAEAEQERSRLKDKFAHLTEMQQQHARQSFEAFSSDSSDGKSLSKEKLAPCLSSCGLGVPAQAADWVKAFQTKEERTSGALGWESFKAFFHLMHELHHAPMKISDFKEVFEEMDQDHNGKVDAAELKKALDSLGVDNVSTHTCAEILHEMEAFESHEHGHEHGHDEHGHEQGDAHEHHEEEAHVEVSFEAMLGWFQQLEEKLHVHLIN